MEPGELLAQLRSLSLNSKQQLTLPADSPNTLPYFSSAQTHSHVDHVPIAARLAAAHQALGAAPQQSLAVPEALPLHVMTPTASAPRPAAAGLRSSDEKVRRTIYVTDVDPSVCEEQLGSFFRACGPIVDARICGDPNSAMRFAFVEFLAEPAARSALACNGARLGAYAIRVSPSKTAIVPVNNQLLPRSMEERAAVARTVYITNVDRVVERDTLRGFFEHLCGPVDKIRLLGDAQHSTKIAFVEFVHLDGARTALRCSGALLGTLPIRISPSKTPVRMERPAAAGPAAGRAALASTRCSPRIASGLPAVMGAGLPQPAPSSPFPCAWLTPSIPKGVAEDSPAQKWTAESFALMRSASNELYSS